MPTTDKDSGHPSPADDTSYNRYSRQSDSGTDNPSDTGKHREDAGVMSPFYLFSTAEMAVLLNKSPITIRLEARKKHIGVKKDGRFYFNDGEKRRMIESFMTKKRTIVSPDIPIMTAVMRRLDVVAGAAKQAVVDTERTTILLHEVFTKLTERIEALEEKLKEGR